MDHEIFLKLVELEERQKELEEKHNWIYDLLVEKKIFVPVTLPDVKLEAAK